MRKGGKYIRRAKSTARFFRSARRRPRTKDVRVDRLIRRGSSLEVDLPGERSYLRQIDMRYRSNVGISLGPDGIRLQQALVQQ